MKSFADYERRIIFVAKNYLKRSSRAVQGSMVRVLKEIALADSLTSEQRGSLAASLYTFWPDVKDRPSLSNIASQMTDIRQAAHNAEQLRREPPASDPGPTPRVKQGNTHTVYLRHDVYVWFMEQCPASRRDKAQLVRGISAVHERLTTPRKVPGEVANLLDSSDSSVPLLSARSVNDLALLDRLEQGQLFDRLRGAIGAMREAARVIELVALNEPVGDGVRAHLHEELTNAAYLLEELLERGDAPEPEPEFDPLHDDE